MDELPVNVTSPDDPRVTPFRNLQGPRGEDLVIVEGAIAVSRLLASGRPVGAVLATSEQAARLLPHLSGDTALLVADAATLRRVVGFHFHRGCLASTPRPVHDAPAVDRLLERLHTRPRLTIVALVGLADPVNVGAIIRSARAFAVDLVLCDAHGADPWSRRAIRASMGNVFALPVLHTPAIEDAVSTLHRRLGLARIVTTLDPASPSLSDLDWPARALVLLGNEGDGLSAQVRARADRAIRIPMESAADSLNVASAAAIVLHHAYTVQNRD